MGNYTRNLPQNLSISLVCGKVGEGTIKDTVIEIQLPSREQAISETRALIEPFLKNVEGDDQDKIAEELVTALTASTILHEDVHRLIDSKPGSKFSSDLEAATGLLNEHGNDSTLLDEGLAYAIQAIYAPTIKPVGNLTSTLKKSDNKYVKQRKALG